MRGGDNLTRDRSRAPGGVLLIVGGRSDLADLVFLGVFWARAECLKCLVFLGVIRAQI